jgi:hypothetical protein
MGAAIRRQMRSDAVRRPDRGCFNRDDVRERHQSSGFVGLRAQFGTKRLPLRIRPPEFLLWPFRPLRFAAPDQAPSLSCRLYRDAAGQAEGAPSVEALRRVLEQASAQG